MVTCTKTAFFPYDYFKICSWLPPLDSNGQDALATRISFFALLAISHPNVDFRTGVLSQLAHGVFWRTKNVFVFWSSASSIRIFFWNLHPWFMLFQIYKPNFLSYHSIETMIVSFRKTRSNRLRPCELSPARWLRFACSNSFRTIKNKLCKLLLTLQKKASKQ